jgi:hypothetical protein
MSIGMVVESFSETGRNSKVWEVRAALINNDCLYISNDFDGLSGF